MGCGGSQLSVEDRERLKASKKIDQDTATAQHSESVIKKLLLLGAGESGKSTLFKQMIELYGNGFPEEERKTYINIVYNNTMSCMKVLLRKTDDLGNPLAEENKASQKYIIEQQNGVEIDNHLADEITKVWADTGIQKSYEMRSKFQLPDSAEYFFNRVYEISKPGYIPSKEDILRSRVRTTGIVETQFSIDDTVFRMFDVGGQRNERKK